MERKERNSLIHKNYIAFYLNSISYARFKMTLRKLRSNSKSFKSTREKSPWNSFNTDWQFGHTNGGGGCFIELLTSEIKELYLILMKDWNDLFFSKISTTIQWFGCYNPSIPYPGQISYSLGPIYFASSIALESASNKICHVTPEVGTLH